MAIFTPLPDVEIRQASHCGPYTVQIASKASVEFTLTKAGRRGKRASQSDKG
jgi:hypothetical protein